jgi:hypothetical protein
MDHIVLLKIESLHARLVRAEGLKLRYKRRDFLTGSITAVLDETADPPANLGLLNVSAGSIRLCWQIVVTMPFLADACLAGQLSGKERGVVKITFDESGPVKDDDSGFDAKGSGSIIPGTIFDGAMLPLQSNLVRTPAAANKIIPLAKTLASGKPVPCGLLPESYLDVVFPSSLGGGTHRLNLAGGFVLVPILTHGKSTGTKRTRR